MFAFLTLVSAKPISAQEVSEQRIREAMRKAATYYYEKVSSHGGYVYHYLLDGSRQWGEGEATDDQIWVQPPGTPTVGMAYVKAYQATGEPFYLQAATDAAEALAYGQLKSGGWRNLVDFDPESPHVAQYRHGGRGRNQSSLDDGQTQSALQLLIAVDRAHEFNHRELHEAAMYGLRALLAAQFPNGGFPQVWTEPVEDRPVIKANFPDHDWRTEGRIKNYWDHYTINDDVPKYLTETLIEAHETYHADKYLQALRGLGDFLILAQLPEPQPGWAQQYNAEMQPIWARRFEPPAVAGAETASMIETLMRIADYTGDRKYLEPIPAALAWLERSKLPSGEIARYYALETNRPLYMQRSNDRYELTYDDSRLPDHYGWKWQIDLDSLRQQYQRAKAGKTPKPPASEKEISAAARAALGALDSQGRWVSVSDGRQMIGDLKLPPGTKFLSSAVFSENLTALARRLRL